MEDLVCKCLGRVCQQVRRGAYFHVVLDILGVLGGHVDVHSNVELVCLVLVLVRLDELRVLPQLLYDRLVDVYVLQGTVQNDQALEVDRPVLHVADVSLNDGLESIIHRCYFCLRAI